MTTIIRTCKEFTQRSFDAQCHEKGTTREYERSWLVVTSSPQDNGVNVQTEFMSATGLNLGSPYPGDPYAYLLSVNGKSDGEDGCNWILTAKYGQFAFGNTSDCPWTQPSQMSWDYQQFEQILDYDVDNKAILNSTGDPFANPVTRDQCRAVLTVTQAEQSFQPQMSMMYSDTINSNAFCGASAGQLKIPCIPATRVWDARWGFYWQVRYTFQFNPLTWDKQILDQGYYELDSDTGKKKPILINGALASSPQLLDGSGAALPKGGQPYFFTFKVYQRVPFNFIFR